ncbi:MAG: hypothetical protein ACREVG_07705, partial [Burkholderiales bacterium]
MNYASFGSICSGTLRQQDLLDAFSGDGADFGYWLQDMTDFDGLRVNDTSEVPSDYSGEVLHVNDHGN